MPQTLYTVEELGEFGDRVARRVLEEFRREESKKKPLTGLKPRYRLRDVAKAWGKDERTLLKALEDKRLFLPLQDTRDIVLDAEKLEAYIAENEVDGATILERLRARRRKPQS